MVAQLLMREKEPATSVRHDRTRQNAIDHVNQDLQSGPLTPEQKDYLTSNLQECRDELFGFLRYMPPDKLEAARRRVEEENVKNREEFDSKNLGSDK